MVEALGDGGPEEALQQLQRQQQHALAPHLEARAVPAPPGEIGERLGTRKGRRTVRNDCGSDGSLYAPAPAMAPAGAARARTRKQLRFLSSMEGLNSILVPAWPGHAETPPHLPSSLLFLPSFLHSATTPSNKLLVNVWVLSSYSLCSCCSLLAGLVFGWISFSDLDVQCTVESFVAYSSPAVTSTSHHPSILSYHSLPLSPLFEYMRIALPLPSFLPPCWDFFSFLFSHPPPKPPHLVSPSADSPLQPASEER